MPIYEYRCPNCKKRVSVFFRSLSSVDHAAARCPNCNSAGLTRLMSRVRVIRSGTKSSGDDEMGDMPDFSDMDENDPRAMGRFMRKMAEESGEDMPPEFNEVIGRLEKGESPEAIEESMPELADLGGDDQSDSDSVD